MPPRQPPRGRGKPKPPPRTRRAEPEKPKEREAPKQWGSLARKGVGRMRDDRPYKAANAFEAAAPPERRQQDEWVRTDVRDEAEGAVARASKQAKTQAKKPAKRP